jgi:hypothetical protein
VEQEWLTLTEHLRLFPIFSGIRITRKHRYITGADDLSIMHLYKEESEDTKGGNQYP